MEIYIFDIYVYMLSPLQNIIFQHDIKQIMLYLIR